MSPISSWTSGEDGLGATHFVFANNIIQGGDRAVSIHGPLPDAKWEGNIVWETSDGELPSSGFVSTDPHLEHEAGSTFRLKAQSPAIGAAVGSYPDIDIDIDGQKRPERHDVGADQYLDADRTNRVLTPADVGPGAP